MNNKILLFTLFLASFFNAMIATPKIQLYQIEGIGLSEKIINKIDAETEIDVLEKQLSLLHNFLEHEPCNHTLFIVCAISGKEQKFGTLNYFQTFKISKVVTSLKCNNNQVKEIEYHFDVSASIEINFQPKNSNIFQIMYVPEISSRVASNTAQDIIPKMLTQFFIVESGYLNQLFEINLSELPFPDRNKLYSKINTIEWEATVWREEPIETKYSRIQYLQKYNFQPYQNHKELKDFCFPDESWLKKLFPNRKSLLENLGKKILER